MNKLATRTAQCVSLGSDFDAIILYSIDPDGALSYLYKKYSGMLHKMGKKYYSLDVYDIDSFVWTTIDKAVNTFKKGNGANFSTFLTRLMSNVLKNEVRRLKVTSVKRDWYMEVEFEAGTPSTEDEDFNLFSSVGFEEDYTEIDISNSLDTLPLTENQYNYIQCIISNGQIMRDSEVAREIGVSPSAVKNIKKSLALKLENFFD